MERYTPEENRAFFSHSSRVYVGCADRMCDLASANTAIKSWLKRGDGPVHATAIAGGLGCLHALMGLPIDRLLLVDVNPSADIYRRAMGELCADAPTPSELVARVMLRPGPVSWKNQQEWLQTPASKRLADQRARMLSDDCLHLFETLVDPVVIGPVSSLPEEAMVERLVPCWPPTWSIPCGTRCQYAWSTGERRKVPRTATLHHRQGALADPHRMNQSMRMVRAAGFECGDIFSMPLDILLPLSAPRIVVFTSNLHLWADNWSHWQSRMHLQAIRNKQDVLLCTTRSEARLGVYSIRSRS